MAGVITEHDQDTNALRRFVAPVVILLLLVALGWWLYTAMSNDRTGVRRPPEPSSQIDLLPPPPPPPPPPPQEEIPPEKIEEATPDPTPAPSPEPQAEAPAPMQMDAAPSAGSDAFGISAGKGGGIGAPGSIGTCVGPNCGAGKGGGGAFSDSFYRRYLGSALEGALRRDQELKRQRFTVTALIWVDGSGRVSRAELANGSGDAVLDKQIVESLRNIASLRPPQEGVRFPQRTVIRGATRGI